MIREWWPFMHVLDALNYWAKVGLALEKASFAVFHDKSYDGDMVDERSSIQMLRRSRLVRNVPEVSIHGYERGMTSDFPRMRINRRQSVMVCS